MKKEFRVNGSNTSIMAWTIDISNDLKSNMKISVNDLQNLIQHAVAQSEKFPVRID